MYYGFFTKTLVDADVTDAAVTVETFDPVGGYCKISTDDGAVVVASLVPRDDVSRGSVDEFVAHAGKSLDASALSSFDYARIAGGGALPISVSAIRKNTQINLLYRPGAGGSTDDVNTAVKLLEDVYHNLATILASASASPTTTASVGAPSPSGPSAMTRLSQRLG